MRAVAPTLALAAVRAVFAWPLARELAAPLVHRAAQLPRGETALLEHGAVLLVDALRDPSVGPPSAALVIALSAGSALASLVPTSWLVTALANPRMAAREAFSASLHRVPDLALAWGLTALLLAALAAIGARVAGTVLAACPATPPISLRTAAIVAVALGPAALAAPWADVARVRSVVLGGDPIDALRASLYTIAKWGVFRAWATWTAFGFAALVVLGLVFVGLASRVGWSAGDRAVTAAVAALVVVAAVAPAALRSIWLARIVKRVGAGHPADVHEGLPPSTMLEYDSASSPSDMPR